MITREEADRLRTELLGVLSEDARNTERLLARLDSIRRESGVGAHAALLLILTRLSFEEQEARRQWVAVLEHREAMAAALGRDPGIRVALLDYFTHINRRLVQPTLIDLEMLDATLENRARDPLTGLATDETFRSALQQELRRARRYTQKTAVVLFDVDELAEINRQFGELVGDRLLREAAILLSNKIRDIDVAARPGEDEFALLLPETDRNGALLVAERYRAEAERFFAGRESGQRPVGLTLSAGLACYPDDATSPQTLLEYAARALYHAKAAGKNVVQVYRPERRRFLRFELEPGRFVVEVLASRDLAPARMRNLSGRGVMFRSPEPLDVGEEIEIRLAEPGADPVAGSARLRGVVVRLEGLPVAVGADGTADASGDRFEIGVAFDLERSDDSDLSTFLDRIRRSRGEGDP